MALTIMKNPPKTMDVERAFVSFLIAAAVPALISIILSIEEFSGQSILFFIVWFVVWYLFTLPIAFTVGFASLFIAIKVKYGGLFLPPLTGGLAGLSMGALSSYRDMDGADFVLLILFGVITAEVAAIVYFKPWDRKKGGAL